MYVIINDVWPVLQLPLWVCSDCKKTVEEEEKKGPALVILKIFIIMRLNIEVRSLQKGGGSSIRKLTRPNISGIKCNRQCHYCESYIFRNKI